MSATEKKVIKAKIGLLQRVRLRATRRPTLTSLSLTRMAARTGDGRERANEWLRTSAWSYLTDDLSENFRSLLDEIGFDVQAKGLYWSLSHCQGDGVEFEGSLDIDTFLAVARVAATPPGRHGQSHFAASAAGSSRKSRAARFPQFARA